MLLKEGAERAGDGFRQSFFHAGPEDLIAVRGAGRDGGRKGGKEGGREGEKERAIASGKASSTRTQKTWLLREGREGVREGGERGREGVRE